MTDEAFETCPFCAGPVVVTTFPYARVPPLVECKPCGVAMSCPQGVAQLRDNWNARADASTAQSDETEAPAPETETKWANAYKGGRLYDTKLYDSERAARRAVPSKKVVPVEVRIPKPPRKRVVYVNVYPRDFDGSYAVVGRYHDTREQADKAAHTTRTACVRIEMVEGKYHD